LNARATTRYIGAGAIIVTKGDNLVAIALAHGLAIGLMFVVFGAVDKRGLAIGLAITMDIFAGGPIVSAVIAALVYTYFLLDESAQDETVDLPQE
jgi:hypothetical protein